MNYNKLKLGDWVWTIQYGWVQISKITSTQIAVNTRNEDEVIQVCYTRKGKFFGSDKFPSLFPEALPQVDPFSQSPCLTKGDTVLVRHNNTASWKPAYFAAYKPGCPGIMCFKDGKTEWSSQGDMEYFSHYRIADCASPEVSK